jgi:WD40 repeat protein
VPGRLKNRGDPDSLPQRAGSASDGCRDVRRLRLRLVSSTRKALGDPLRHGSWVRVLAFSPDNQSLVTVSGDATLCVWELTGKKQLVPRSSGSQRPGPLALKTLQQQFVKSGRGLAAAFSPDGRPS